MKFFCLQSLCIILCAFTLQAQTLLQENFEGNTIPENWTQQTLASDGGWNHGTAQSLSSQYWQIQDNGGRFMATNDDGCNCDKSADYLILPPLNFSDLQTPLVELDLFFGRQGINNSLERAYIEVSTDNGTTWAVVKEFEGVSGWQYDVASLSDYAGQSNVLIAIRYFDDGGWMFGMAIDNVVVREQTALDLEVATLDLLDFGESATAYPITVNIVNKGADNITSFDISYAVNGQTITSTSVEGIDIPTFSTYIFEFEEAWIPQEEGLYSLEINVSNVNNSLDDEPNNNTLLHEITIYEKVVVPNRIDEYIEKGASITEIASTEAFLDKPTDLDFFPILGKYELWVINERVENLGGSTVTFYNVGQDDQEALERIDGNAWHFMSLPTGIAFAESGFFGTSTGVLDANHNGGTFTGPTLWTSDPSIYARPSGGNGSHMDMLHGSPYSMGIAHEVDNAYWIYDGYNNHPVRYDFVEDHGPGNDDHSDGLVRRYTEIELQREGSIPSHMVVDKTTGWLYFNDVGNERVLRLNINSGEVFQALNEINEPLAEHSEMYNVEWEVIIDEGLDQPSGIEVIGNRLLVGDYATGEIVIYDIENNFEELGRIETGSEGLTGLKVGPEGRIWFTNRLLNQLNVIEVNESVNTQQIALQNAITLAPNPTNGFIWIDFDMPFEGTVTILQADGRQLSSQTISAQQRTNLDLTTYASGVYWLQFENENTVVTKRVQKTN